MALFNRNTNKADYDRYAPKKTGILLVLSTVWRELLNLITLNFTFDIFLIPFLFAGVSLMFIPEPTCYFVSLGSLFIEALLLPTAQAALSRITVTMVRDENFFPWKDFWASWKKNFGKSFLGGLILNFATFCFVLAFIVYRNIFGTGSMLMVVIGAFCACLVIITITASMYFYPMLAYVNLGLKALLKNSLIMVMGCWKRSILAWLALIPSAFILCMALLGVDTEGKLYITLFTGGGSEVALVFVLLIGFSIFSLFLSFAVYPAIRDRVLRKEEAPAPSLATQLHSKEGLKWEQEELKSASIKDLDFGPDEAEEKTEDRK